MRTRQAWVRRLRSERGAISAEYVALLALVVAVLAAIPYADIGTAVRDEVEDPICAIATDRDLEGGCGGDGEHSDAATDGGAEAEDPPATEQSRGLGGIGAERAALPSSQTAVPPAGSPRGEGGGATLLPVAAVTPPVRPAYVGPVVKKLVKEVGGPIVRGLERLFGKGRKPPAARPAPKAPPKINLETTQSVRGRTPSEIDQVARQNGYKHLPARRGGGGDRYFKPGTRMSDGIRVMRGDPKASDPIKQGPYAIIAKGGKNTRVPLKGNPTLGKGKP